MHQRAGLCIGIFLVMALSNAIVPVLPGFAERTADQGIIFSAYFLGAFLTTIPAGLLSDRFGKPVIIRIGLLVTIASGLAIAAAGSGTLLVFARLLEGLAAGLVVASGLSWVNSQADHRQLSGYFMASLNFGLVAGLVATGWIADLMKSQYAGIQVFTALLVIPAVMSWGLRDAARKSGGSSPGIIPAVSRYRWLWYGTAVLIGVTGVATALYPAYSGNDPGLLGIQIAGMSVATILAALAASRFSLPPVRVIRIAAILMAGGILLCAVTAWSFLLLGALAGIVQIALMALLAENREIQGTIMGLFSAVSYAGMALFPALAGFVAGGYGFPAAFGVTAVFAVSVAVTAGRTGQDRSFSGA
ncbi:MAG: MFS transporter [Methanoregulaceae archaeon]